ncbi:MAG: Gfo/Idh/MocA family oxidoreductase [Hyphomicrobiales bacterium]|nr:Gfo/Idh/MocA family oxidoreductase [Hyphomicrobiales bacterium]
MAAPVRIAVMGAGLIGKRHAEHVVATPGAELFCIIDPMPAGGSVAAALGAPWFKSFADMLAKGRPDAIIVATPNQLHVEHGLACIEAGLPVLVEKPLADDLAGATRLVDAAAARGVPLLTGHHRRHNPLMRQARAWIDEGRLGQLLAVHGFCWFFKPDDYFNVGWRRLKGAGPVMLNLIHDVDCLRMLCGEVESVQALESNAVRGNEVEETCALLLKFRNGALGTITVSDAVAAPWSWELTAGENPAYPHMHEPCYMLGGTRGSLSVPDLRLISHVGAPGWMRPMQAEFAKAEPADPLRRQIEQLCRVVSLGEAPLVSGRDGLETLRVILAVKEAAATGKSVKVASPAA